MPILTGHQGHVLRDGTPLGEITHWTLKIVRRYVAYASSATGGYRRRLPSVREGQGRIQFALSVDHPASAALAEGDELTLALCLDTERCYVVPAVIEIVHLETDISGGGPILGSAEFATNGAWTEPG